jgi:AraC-like DNA-binding protein
MERACALLSCSNIPVTELSDQLGFVNSQSFSRLFTQRMGVSPSRYRAFSK